MNEKEREIKGDRLKDVCVSERERVKERESEVKWDSQELCERERKNAWEDA